VSWLRARAASFGHALRGLAVFAREPNVAIHLAVAAAVVALSAWLELALAQRALLILAIGLVLGLADRVAPERHPLVAKAKDVAAAGVLLAALAAAAAGLMVVGPPLLAKLGAP
jgi:diacylglycerol kinase